MLLDSASCFHQVECDALSVSEKRMKKNLIPDELKEEALRSIERFNQTTLAETEYTFVARFQGGFLYLDRNELGQVLPICRLQYRGASQRWDFAIYKYSSQRYDAFSRRRSV